MKMKGFDPKNKDMKFMASIFDSISDYAHEHGYSADLALYRTADLIQELLKEGTFDNEPEDNEE